jgi:hypothetical protein
MRTFTTLAMATVLVAGSTLTLAGPTGAAATVDARWSGYSIDATPNAAGGWLGGRTIDTTRVYRIDPGAATGVASAFAAPVKVATLAGRGPKSVSSRDTQRAAWIVAKFGTYKYNVQNAAVEVALDELLYGGVFAFTGTATAARLRQTGDAAQIRSFVSDMLNDSAKYAGPYTVKITAPAGQVGVASSITVKVTSSSSSEPISGLPVTLTYPGVAAKSADTKASGVASFTVTPTAGGPVTVSARVDLLPTSKLTVRTPTPSSASRVVEAGLKESATATVTQSVKATPGLALVSTRNPLQAGKVMAGTATVSAGYPQGRGLTLRVHGPFTTATSTCDPAKVIDKATLTVKANATYAWPASLIPTKWGYYLVSGQLAATTYNTERTTCGALTKVKAVPGVSAARLSTPVKVGSAVSGQLAATLPTTDRVAGTMSLYGPFSTTTVNCKATKLIGTGLVNTSGTGKYLSTPLTVTKPGYYVWRAALTEGAWNMARTGACGSKAAKFRVTR